MADLFLNDPVALRHCILYEFVGGVPVFQDWNNFCKKVGDNVIDYVDYEYWYMRFAQKQFDMNHDRSTDPETRNISHVPTGLLDKILNNLQPMEKMSARKVCKKFRGCIDQQDPGFNRISISKNFYHESLRFDSHYYLTYKNRGADCVVSNRGNETVIENTDSATLICRHMLNVLKKTKHRMGELNFMVSSEMYTKLQELLAQRSIPIEVEADYLEISTAGDAPAESVIFSMIKFNNLKIDLRHSFLDGPQGAERISRICEVASKTGTISITLVHFESFPIECFLNFERALLDMKLDIYDEDLGHYLRTLLTSTVINRFEFRYRLDTDGIGEFIRSEINGHVQLLHLQGEEEVTFFTPITGSDKYYKVTIDSSSTEIQRGSLNFD